jgi:hypothetical protein
MAYTNTEEQALINFNLHKKNLYQALINGNIVAILSGWQDHSVNFVFFNNLIFVCNRGDRSSGEAGIQIYQLDMTKQERLLTALSFLVRGRGPSTRHYIEEGIHEFLGTKKIGHISLKEQSASNCSWTSSKAMLLAIFYAQLLRKNSIENIYDESYKLYKAWSTADRKTALQNYASNFSSESALYKIALSKMKNRIEKSTTNNV